MQFILLQATGNTAGGQSSFGGSGIIFMIIMFVILYFLMIRPQQKKQKETQIMQEGLRENDKVLTASGIYGRVVSLKPDKNIVVVEIDSTNKIRVDFQRNAIVSIITPEKSSIPE